MAKKNRPSVLKRQREAEKRQRLQRKAAKTAEKREKKLQRKADAALGILPDQVIHDAENEDLPPSDSNAGDEPTAPPAPQ